MKASRSLWTVGLMVASLLGGVSSAYAQSQGGNCRYFAETSHYVCDEFLEFFETRGGIEIFGFPLTEAFHDPDRGLQVQYFQRARMEQHSYNASPYKVQLGLLVDELGYNSFPSAISPPPFNSSLHHYFPETDHVVSFAFLEYFREHGDVDIFGYPRSEFLSENGYIVQYFQRARMEWHPEASPGSKMRLSNVGEEYVREFGIDVSSRPDTHPLVTKLGVSASVRHVTTGQGGTQTVFVYVVDQQQRPVQGAAVSIVVHYQSSDQRYEFEPTNASGYTNHSFEIPMAPPGQKVMIDVTVTYGSLTGTTQTFFVPWW